MGWGGVGNLLLDQMEIKLILTLIVIEFNVAPELNNNAKVASYFEKCWKINDETLNIQQCVPSQQPLV